jgi:hypothetical protein
LCETEAFANFIAMFRRVAYQFSVIVIAGVLALASSGMSVDLHFCQGYLHSVSLIGEARSCHDQLSSSTCHEKSSKSCCSKKSAKVEKECTSGCCQKETIFLDFDEEYMVWASESAGLDQLNTLSGFGVDYSQCSKRNIDPCQVDYLNYKPPLIARDFFSINQVFLL